MFDVFLKIFVLVSLIAHLNFMPQSIFDMFYFQTFSVVLICIGLTSNPVREFKFKKWFLIPVFLNALQIYFYFFNPYNFAYFMNFGLSVMLLFVVIRYCKNIESVVTYILYGALLNFMFMTVQYIAISNSFIELFKILQTCVRVEVIKGRVSSFGGAMGNCIRIMYLLSITLPLFLYYGKKCFFITGILFSVAGFAYFPRDHQFNVLIVFIITSMFLIPKYTPKFKLSRKQIVSGICLVLLLVGSYLYFFQRETWDGSITARLHYWERMFTESYKNKVDIGLGVTIGSGIDIMTNQKFRDPDKDWSTLSSYLFFITGFGVGGLFFIIMCIYKFIRNFKVGPIDLSLLGVLILCIFEYLFEIRRLHPSMLVIIAGFIILRVINRRYC